MIRRVAISTALHADSLARAPEVLAVVNQTLDRLLLLQSVAAQPDDTTPAALGALTMATLEKISGGITVFEGTSSEAVLNEAEALALEACVTEASIVRTATPALWRLSDAGDPDDGTGVRPVLAIRGITNYSQCCPSV